MRLLTKIFLFECLLSNEFTKWPGLLYPTRTYSDSCVLSVGKVGNLMIDNLSTYRVLSYTGCNKIDGGRIQFKGKKRYNHELLTQQLHKIHLLNAQSIRVLGETLAVVKTIAVLILMEFP